TADGPGCRSRAATAVRAWADWRGRRPPRRRPAPRPRRRPRSAPCAWKSSPLAFPPGHEGYQALEIVRRARRALPKGGHGAVALDGVVEQDRHALLPAPVPVGAVMDQRRAGVRDGVAGLA